MLHCFAGCAPESVCAALGITMRDLFFDHAPRPADNPVARKARLEAGENVSKNLPRAWREEETTVIYVSENALAEGIARALALSVEGEHCVAVLADKSGGDQ